MTVWCPKGRKIYRYRFHVEGEPYEGSTGQITQADAEEFEQERIRAIRRQRKGLELAPEHSPRIADWAEVYCDHLEQKGSVRRIDRVEDLLRVVLRFWGAKPKDPVEGAPYHDLRLIDPILNPSWIVRFDEWIRTRRVHVGRDEDKQPITRPVSEQTRRHYYSIMSRLYRAAMLPNYRAQTGVKENPFLVVERGRRRARKVTVTPEELRRWLACTPKHAQLAIAIAALIPKLRLQNVLGLEWDRSFDEDLQFVTVLEHKTVDQTEAPLVAAISPQARAWLKAARAASTTRWVITYRGKPVKSIRHAVATGARRAGLTYGRDIGGVTFHTIRHTAATLLAEVPALTEAQRAGTMGHSSIQTTQGYTHLRPAAEAPIVEQLGDVLALEDLLRASFGPAGGDRATIRAVPPSGMSA